MAKFGTVAIDVRLEPVPYVKALESVASASEALMDCLCEFGQENNSVGVWYCAELYQALGDALAVLAMERQRLVWKEGA